MIDWTHLKNESTEGLVEAGLRGYAQQDYRSFYQCLGELLRRVERRTVAKGKPYPATAKAARYLSYLVMGEQARGGTNPVEKASRVVLLLEGPNDSAEKVAEAQAELLRGAARDSVDPDVPEVDKAAVKAVELVVESVDRFEPGWCHLCWPTRSRAIPGDMVCRDHS